MINNSGTLIIIYDWYTCNKINLINKMLLLYSALDSSIKKIGNKFTHSFLIMKIKEKNDIIDKIFCYIKT